MFRGKSVKVYLFLSLLGAILFAVAAYAQTPKQGGTLVWGRGADSVGLDQAHEDDGESFKVAENIFDNLVQFKTASTEIEPGLATSWEVSADGLIYTFKLRPGVMFHDGTPFNAAAVVFSIERQFVANHPFAKTGGPYKYWGYMGMSGIVKSVKAIDDSTVQFQLKKPEAPFLSNLAMGFAAIVSPQATNKHRDQFGRNPVGTGPFKFVEWITDDRIVLEANEDYWGGRPFLDRVIFRSIPDNTARLLALRAGEIDVMQFLNPDDINVVKRDKNLVLITQPGMNVGYLAMNMNRIPFDRLKVRLAINHAINKKAIVESIYGELGMVAKNPLPPSLWGYNDNIEDYEYNPTKAKRLLAEAGYENGFRTTLWAMPVPRPYNPNGRRVAEAMQADLAEVGIRAEIVSYDWGTYLDKTDHGEHDMALLGWSGDNGDPDNFLYILLGDQAATIPASNIAFYMNPDKQVLLEKAKVTSDLEERARLYKSAQVIIHRDAPWVPLAHSIQTAVMNKKVHGVTLSPTTLVKLHKVWIE